MTTGADFAFADTEPRDRDEERADAVPSAEELLAAHGRSVLDYASLCTVPRRGAAERLAGQAFRNAHADLAPHVGAGFPWRPRLLTAVHDAALEWRTDDRRSSLHPDLRDGVPGDARPAAPATGPGSGTGGLVLRALRNLPDRVQSLLWHTVVEAEDLETVAPLLGAEPFLLNPERARALLRDECVRVHLDRAPDERCRRLNRLIDVHARPGTTEMMAEVRDHLDVCAYCRAAVDRLDQSPDRLPTLLAEAVLGFRAADYLATRPARRATASARVRSASAPVTEDEGTPPAAPAAPAPRRRRWPLLVVSGVVLCGVVAATPMVLGGTDGDREAAGASVPGPAAPSSGTAPGRSAVPPAREAPAPGTGEAAATRLRNARTGLCLDLRAATDATDVEGVPAVTAECGESATQLWWLEDGGRLRNRAAPDLCLNAEPQGTVALRPCADQRGADGEASDDGDTRYDLADDGLLTLAALPGVAMTPIRLAEGAVILLEPVPEDRVRRSQRWRADEGAAGTPLPSGAVREAAASTDG
ncbi:ricin-type beta-trefoil lectin domain protein [Streptomyces brasiliscabiei]|uniref:ricin-type beta-trefoil lectin domain protein n=1 Tax=Streptomyces brasiliscabiei TaxID=2736302 RepID=UPI001C0F9831|nr:ricin-type beta-trefoil lectin domain protein [Streptomyces brasiliscabiei]